MNDQRAAAAAPAPVRVSDVVLLFLAAGIYGGIFPVNRLAAEAAWPPMGFAFLQALIAGAVLAAGLFIARRGLAASWQHVRAYVVIGGLVIGIPIGILVTAAEHVDASVLALVLCLSPIVTILMGALLRIEQFRMRTLVGMILGTAGIAIIVLPEAGVIERSAIGWFLLSLLAPVMFASANNCAKLLRPAAASAPEMAAGTLLGAAAVALVVMLALGSAVVPPALDAASALPLVLAVAINAVFFWLFFELVARIGPARFSLFNYLAVGAGILWSMLAFGEQPAPAFWAALLLMLGGMHLALRQGGKA